MKIITDQTGPIAQTEGRVAQRKLIIQIPCYNEEATLPQTLQSLPRVVPGFDKTEWMVIDDGSTDRTVEVARAYDVDHIISVRHNEGLARAFMTGLNACLHQGAHTIVNIDGDNQYDAGCIPNLVRPIVEGKADLVIGARPISEIDHFSPLKKLLQRFGSWIVRFASGTDVEDAPSGFRAIYWETALRLNVFSDYTYTLETLIQAGRNNMRVASVPVRVNAVTRPSRLIKNVPSYLWRSVATIVRIFLIYKPLFTFSMVGCVFGLLFLAIGGRFLYFVMLGQGDGHVQSLILAAVFAVGFFVSFALAIIGDLISANRLLLEDIRARTLREEIKRLRNQRA